MIETDLDEQIAVRLFGHEPERPCPKAAQYSHDYDEWYCNTCDGEWLAEPSNPHFFPYVAPPFYSRNIERAWQVVDKMLERGFHVELKSTEDGWFCVMSSPPKGKWTELSWVEYMANGKTAAEAICQVALKALQND
jgi:hypothetical protein